MRRPALLALPVLLLAACQTVLSEDRVAPGDIVTVTPDFTGDPIGGCDPGSPVTVYLGDGPEDPGEVVVGTGEADESGQFSVDITVPEDPAVYTVTAECVFSVPVPGGDLGPTRLGPAQLIVEPPLELAVEPAVLDPGEAFTVNGTWCVSRGALSEPPEADIVFDGVAQPTITAGEPQPFGESWTLDLEAPTEPGTYEITGTCTFDDADQPPADLEGPATQLDAPAESLEYPVIEVVVVAPAVEETTTTSTTTPTTTSTRLPPAPAVSAVAARAEPTFTG